MRRYWHQRWSAPSTNSVQIVVMTTIQSIITINIPPIYLLHGHHAKDDVHDPFCDLSDGVR